MDPINYETLVRETIESLPEHLRLQLQDVIIAIEEKPPVGHEGILLGLYEGIPLTTWGRGEVNGRLPDKITLFTESIERVARKLEDIPDLVHETLLHEIAHYFGFEHEHIQTMERRWRKQRK